jgi:hypothetical protein
MKWVSKYLITADNYVIHIVNLALLLFIFRGSLPAFKYPFILLYTFLLIYIALNWKAKLHHIKLFIKTNYLAILLVLYFCFALLTTYKLYLEIVKELINALTLLSISFFYIIIVNSERKIKFALSNLVDWIIVLSIFAALVWIYDFFRIYLPNSNGLRLFNIEVIDYNFAMLPALFGIVAILKKLPGTNTKAQQYTLSFILLLLLLQLFLSTSRRAFIIGNAVLIVVFLLYFISLFARKEWISTFARRVTPFILMIMAILLSGFLFVKTISYDRKKDFFGYLGFVNTTALTAEITGKYLRFASIFDPEKSFHELYRNVWTPNLDPNDPESGWGQRIHKIVFPLSGRNSELIPAGAKGYMMDHTCDAWVYEGVAYSYTNVDMEEHMVLDNDTIKSSIFCFVSTDYDGDEVFMVVSDKAGRWIGYSSYDLENKGMWQELEIQIPVSFGQISTYIYFKKIGASNFTNLNGHVIFAYPQYSNLTQAKRLSIVGTETSVMPSQMDMTNIHSELLIGHDFQPVKLNLSLLSSLMKIPITPTGDPIRNLVSIIIQEDTIYRSYKSNLEVGPFSNRTGEDRVLRWQFAWQIFKNEYDWKQKVFGGGFSFLNWYGAYFLHDKTKTDHPHNPFMYILLYSGILGTLLYGILLVKTLCLYIKYLKDLFIFSLFFIIVFFFTFFSGGSPLDPPVMGFLILLPFIVHASKNRILSNKSISPDSIEG